MTTLYTDRDRNDRYRLNVEHALNEYRNNSDNCSAGYSILRYTALGYVKVSHDVDAQAFVDWYPLHAGYIILRLAKAGKLSYRTAVHISD